MNTLKRSLLALAIAGTFAAGAAQAQISDNMIKIGVLSDMSSLYTDLAGAGSVVAAKMAVEDSGIEKRGIQGRDRLGRSSEQAGRRLGDRAPVVRHREGRRHRRRAEFRRCAGGQPDHQGQGQGVPRVGPGLVRPDRQGVLAQHRALDLRHLDAGQRHRHRDHQARRQHVVLHHGRLRVRAGAGARHRRPRCRRTAARCWARSRRRSTRRTSRRSCCRRRHRRPRSSASPTPAATRPTRSSRRRSSASSRAARASPACWCSSPTCTRSACRPRRA